MDKLKSILTVIAVILVALAVLAGINLLYSLLFYAVVIAVVCFGGMIALRLMRKPDNEQLQAPDPKKELQKVQRLLDQYKQK